MHRPSFVLLLVLLLWGSRSAPCVFAQEPGVRAELSTKPPYYAGRNLTLVIELLAPGYFASAATFDVSDPKGLIIIPPLGSPVVSSESQGDTTYTVQRHELSILVPDAGDKVIPPLTVRFQYKKAPLDKESVPAVVHSPEVKLQTVQPPGTEGLGQIISARGLTVTEQWKPDPASVKPKAGDAFTRTITFTARDMPGMMFPPFPSQKLDGIAIYTKEPEVQDHSERGDLLGKRVDTLTYLLQKPGQFTLPGAKFSWWDLDASELRTIELPPHSIRVAPNPALASANSPLQSATPSEWSTRTRVALSVAAFLAMFCAASRRARQQITAWFRLFRPVRLEPLNPPEQ